MAALELEDHSFYVPVVLVRLKKLQTLLRISPLQNLDCFLTRPSVHIAPVGHVKIDRVATRQRPTGIIEAVDLSRWKQTEGCAC